MMRMYYDVLHPDAQKASSKREQALAALKANKSAYRGTLRMYFSYLDNIYRKIHPLRLEPMSNVNPTELHNTGLNYMQTCKLPALFHDL